MDESRGTIDPEQLAAARAELGASFAKIVGYYRDDGARAIGSIEEAVRHRSAVEMVRPAHTLKGDSLMLGAEALAIAAEEIEKAARSAVESHDFPDDMLPRIRDLRGLFAETLAVLDREVTPARAPLPSAPSVRRGGFGRKVLT